jgi:hypothetical protein
MVSSKIGCFVWQIYNTVSGTSFFVNHFHKKNDICDFKPTTTISLWKKAIKR